MTLSLGLDTGGTYTDAVLFDDASQTVIARAKALTTRHDLSVGIGEAAKKVIAEAAIDTADIGLVSISTTLATNALVEGHGNRAALVMIGFSERDLDRAGLRDALGNDPVFFLPGGHDVHGRASPLDVSPLELALPGLAADVSAVAIAGHFSVRNPEHEIAVRDLVREHAGLPVTCSHELSSKLDGPKRALTTLLNARLIDMIDRLIEVTIGWMRVQGIGAPLMVVRGDGSLVSADFARARPIETILSGPAASLVGAQFLTGQDNAIVSDIGGTTTDIALIEDGRPKLDSGGAVVGGYRTMVEAVAMRTYGLGGDSAVSFDESALEPRLTLGPGRHVPVAMAAHLFPDAILAHLQRQLKKSVPHRLDGKFAWRTGTGARRAAALQKSERALFERVTAAPQPLDTLLQGTAENATLMRLVSNGLVHVCGLTPSDAFHVLGRFSHWDSAAARDAAALFGRRKDARGKTIADSPEAMSQLVVDTLTRTTAARLVETAFCADGLDGAQLAGSQLVTRALDRAGDVIRPVLLFNRPLIALGAAAPVVYPAVAEALVMDHTIPADAGVANAIGAVVGQVRIETTVEIIVTGDGWFQLAGSDLDGVETVRFGTEDEALSAAAKSAEASARRRALFAGAMDAHVSVTRDIKAVTVEDHRQFIGATVTAITTGRPKPAL